jgi:3-oxoacyl-(acyl-carrier-protein) synthase
MGEICATGGVVITGLGVITTLGETPAEYFEALTAGRSGVTRWRDVDERVCSRIGGDMSGFDLEAHLARAGGAYPPGPVARAKKSLRATPLAGRLTAAAALQAFVDARFDAATDPHRLGHVLGGHNLQLRYQHENYETFREEPDFIDPLFGLMALDTDVLSVTSEVLGVKGATMTVGAACASGNAALLAAFDLLRCGRADAVVVSGAAMDLDAVWLQGWAIMEALSFRSFNDAPGRASRPFDRRREGFVPSVGAAAVVLETVANARARSARAHAALLGGRSTSAASRSTRPDLDSQALAMGGALADAGVSPAQVDYINAHATSTPLGDAVEVAAIKRVFGRRAYEVPINATKSMVGHCLTSASMVEMVATVLQLKHSLVHPTINLDEPDPSLDLDFVPHQARPHEIRVALSNAFGFGGLNSCVVVGRPPEGLA